MGGVQLRKDDMQMLADARPFAASRTGYESVEWLSSEVEKVVAS